VTTLQQTHPAKAARPGLFWAAGGGRRDAQWRAYFGQFWLVFGPIRGLR